MSEECLKDSLDSSLGSQCDLFVSLTQPLGNLVCADDLASQLSHEQYDSDETILSVGSIDLPSATPAKQVAPLSFGIMLNGTAGAEVAGSCSQELFTQIDSTQNFASCETRTPDGFENPVSAPQQKCKVTRKRRKKRKRVCYNPRYVQHSQNQYPLSQPISRKSNSKDNIFKKHCSHMEELNLIEAKFATINLLISVCNFEQADLVLQNDVRKRLDHIESTLHEKPSESQSSESDSDARGELADLLEVREQRLRYLLLKADGIEKAITEAKDKDELSQSIDIDASQSIIPNLRQRPDSQNQKPNRPFINRKCASKFIRVPGIQSRLPNAVKKVRCLAQSNSQPRITAKKSNTQENTAKHSKSQKPFLNSRAETSSQATAFPLQDLDFSDVYQMSDSAPGGQLASGNSGAIVKMTPGATVPRKAVKLQNGQRVTVSTTPSPRPLNAPIDGCDFKDLVKRGLVPKAKDVLRCCLEGSEYVSSVVGPGLILSTSLDVHITPEGWLRAVSNLNVSTDIAYRKIFCGGVSLHELRQRALSQSYVAKETTARPTPTYSVMGRPFHIRFASPLNQAQSAASKKSRARRELMPVSLAGKSLQKAPSDPLVDDLCAYLSRCKVVLPRDDELFVTSNLLGDNSDEEFAAMEDLMMT